MSIGAGCGLHKLSEVGKRYSWVELARINRDKISVLAKDDPMARKEEQQKLARLLTVSEFSERGKQTRAGSLFIM